MVWDTDWLAGVNSGCLLLITPESQTFAPLRNPVPEAEKNSLHAPPDTESLIPEGGDGQP